MKGCIIVLVALVLVGCSAPPKAVTQVTLPARVDGMASIKRVGVYEFKNDSLLIRGQVEELLKNAKNKQKEPYFEVLNRDALDLVLKEQGNADSALFDSDQIIELGRLSKAQAIVTGGVQDPILNRTTYQKHETYEICGQRKKGKCTLWVPRTRVINCTNSESSVRFQVHITDVSTGKQILSKTYSGQQQSDVCDQNPPSLATLQKGALRSALRDLRHDIAPYDIRLTIELMEFDDSGMPQKAQTHLDKGVAFINTKHPNVKRGCAEFQKGVSTFGKSPALFYNSGVCQEIQGNLERAADLYTHAEQFLSKPNKLVSKAHRRVQVYLEKRDQLLQQEKKRTQK